MTLPIDVNISGQKRMLFLFMLLVLLVGGITTARPDHIHVEKKIREYITSPEFEANTADRRCHRDGAYRVYLIDNFEQALNLVPEVRTSHGEMLVKLLKTGRDDIDIVVLNTALSKGLAQVIDDIAGGACADAVVSSIPGSNYTYGQVSSLLPDRTSLRRENILYHRSALRRLLRDIAFQGFPSVEWLQNIDVNATKLRNDARKFVYIEALGRLGVPVILPYGNRDATHRGQIKSVNLLSLAANAHVFSALDQAGERVSGFPYSPLSSGDAPAVYDMMECPHPDDPFKAVLDINHDGYADYTFFRTGKIAYRNDRGDIAFAPAVTPQHQFARWITLAAENPECRPQEEIVVTAAQYRAIKARCPSADDIQTSKPYVWLNSFAHGPVFGFEPTCWPRGKIRGTSVIPPNKLKELLPPKADLPSRPENGQG